MTPKHPNFQSIKTLSEYKYIASYGLVDVYVPPPDFNWMKFYAYVLVFGTPKHKVACCDKRSVLVEDLEGLRKKRKLNADHVCQVLALADTLNYYQPE